MASQIPVPAASSEEPRSPDSSRVGGRLVLEGQLVRLVCMRYNINKALQASIGLKGSKSSRGWARTYDRNGVGVASRIRLPHRLCMQSQRRGRCGMRYRTSFACFTAPSVEIQCESPKLDIATYPSHHLTRGLSRRNSARSGYAEAGCHSAARSCTAYMFSMMVICLSWLKTSPDRILAYLMYSIRRAGI